jgi:hypothetical protein
MSNTKQSSVELLAIAIYEKFKMEGNGKELNDLVEQYKAIHKEEIEDAYNDGKNNGMDISHPWSITKEISANEYHNKTYGGNNE